MDISLPDCHVPQRVWRFDASMLSDEDFHTYLLKPDTVLLNPQSGNPLKLTCEVKLSLTLHTRTKNILRDLWN